MFYLTVTHCSNPWAVIRLMVLKCKRSYDRTMFFVVRMLRLIHILNPSQTNLLFSESENDMGECLPHALQSSRNALASFYSPKSGPVIRKKCLSDEISAPTVNYHLVSHYLKLQFLCQPELSRWCCRVHLERLQRSPHRCIPLPLHALTLWTCKSEELRKTKSTEKMLRINSKSKQKSLVKCSIINTYKY